MCRTLSPHPDDNSCLFVSRPNQQEMGRADCPVFIHRVTHPPLSVFMFVVNNNIAEVAASDECCVWRTGYTLWGPGFYVHRKYWRAMRSPWLLRVCRAWHFTSTHTSNIVAIDVVLQGKRRWVLTFIRHTERGGRYSVPLLRLTIYRYSQEVAVALQAEWNYGRKTLSLDDNNTQFMDLQSRGLEDGL